MATTGTRRTIGTVAATGALAIALTGCSLPSDIASMLTGEADRDGAGSVQSTSEIGIFNLQVGDCKMEDQSGEILDTTVVPCDEPHDEEVYDEFAMADGDFPGVDAIQAEAETYCVESFGEFVGMPWEESALEFFAIYPTQGTWEQADDRIVQCVIWDPEGQVTGTLAGAAR
ncbi:septum formation family protein [Microbacterium sp. 2216-1]|uniref:septum formation family protein n=1 Tax=Microbacterium TaxID=33882 RepID=UPI001CD66B37|nr:septum formation family protein [Microbacterium esteraromaticum]MCA1306498.1 septum formation family protein [Microbacterium esteraromaticum]